MKKILIVRQPTIPPPCPRHDDNGAYSVVPRGEARFDVVQRSTGAIVASAALRSTAQTAAESLNACACVPSMQNAD